MLFTAGLIVGIIIGVVGMATVVWLMVAGIVQHLVKLSEGEGCHE